MHSEAGPEGRVSCSESRSDRVRIVVKGSTDSDELHPRDEEDCQHWPATRGGAEDSPLGEDVESLVRDEVGHGRELGGSASSWQAAVAAASAEIVPWPWYARASGSS